MDLDNADKASAQMQPLLQDFSVSEVFTTFKIPMILPKRAFMVSN